MKVCPACGSEYGDDAAFCSRDRTPLPPAGGGLIGQVVGDRYRIERKLGEGGMGEVYLARHVLMDRPCAIKIMAPGLAQDPEAVARFNREATNASRINHPNVCAVYDFGFTPAGLLYLAMEYLDGRELSGILEEGPLPLERAVRLLAQCAAGLQAAHDLGIVHRDLKPDNVMVLDQRGREVVKLVDFGIAKAAQGEATQRVTRTGLVVGTPEYMSPEQLSGDELDGRSDQYSLALVLYRMLTGTLPFTGTSAQDAMVKRLTQRPRPLSDGAGPARYPAALDAVVDRALARKPGERFPTVEEFAAAVARAAAPEPAPVSLPRTLAAPRPSPAGRRAVAAVAALALLGTAFVSWRALSDRAAARRAALQPLGAAADSGAAVLSGGGVDTSAPSPATPPGQESGSPAAGAPSPPPALARPESSLDAGFERRLPTLEDFDDPTSARAVQAFERARLAMNAQRLPLATRARMAWLVGVYYLGRGDRPAAAQAFRRSCRMDPAPRCEAMLRQLRDTP